LPISIIKAEIKTESGGQRMGLRLGLDVKLQKSSGNGEKSGNGFGGKADFTVWAKRNPSTKRWGYDDFQLNEISIEVDQGSFSMKGHLAMFNDDPVYYKGYCGHLEIKIIKKIEVKASAIFGKAMDDEGVSLLASEKMEAAIIAGTEIASERTSATEYRYWFFDAQAKFPGIPFFPGVKLNSFMGGLYYNMEMSKGVVGSTEAKPLCSTASGRTFKPYNGVMGLMAGIGIIDAGGGSAFNGNINFGLEFFIGKNSGQGLKRIATWGGVSFLNGAYKEPSFEEIEKDTEGKTPKKGEDKKVEMDKSPPPAGKLAANWYVEYDFPNKTLVGDFDVFVNMSVIKGTGKKGKAGRISFYSSPSDWYVYFGKPNKGDRIGLRVVNLASIESYLCMGSLLPDPAIAPMPDQIKPTITIDYSLLGTGGGISFGTRFEAKGDAYVPLGFCRLKAGLDYSILTGFDILLSKSSKPINCGGFGERGINNWYATGQAYFYGGADVKVKWDCRLFGDKSKRLFSLWVKAYVFAQFPRPTYIQGEVAAGIKILKKNFTAHFKIKLGDKCDVVSQVSDIYFIDRIIPTDDQEEVAVSSVIRVSFSEEIDGFHYTLARGKSNETYRGHVDESTISVFDAEGNEIEVMYEMAESFKELVLTPLRVLPENSEITVIVNVQTQKKNGSNWSTMYDAIEADTVVFKTGVEPDKIPNNDIYYAYPLPGMTNFYKDVSTQGFVRFAVLPNKSVKLHPDYEYIAAFYDGNNEIDRTNKITYSDQYMEHNFKFDLPVSRLDLGKKYTFKIIKSPIPTGTTSSSTTTGTSTVGAMDMGYEDSVIISYTFYTSEYATFKEKIAVYNSSITEAFQGGFKIDLSGLKNTAQYEALSLSEIAGYEREHILVTDPLIHFGKIDYHNDQFNELADNANSIKDGLSSFSFNNSIKDNVQIFSSAFDDVNSSLDILNMECLLGGGCSSDDLKDITIPKGEIVLPVGYYLPGEDVPVSTQRLIIDLDKDIKIGS